MGGHNKIHFDHDRLIALYESGLSIDLVAAEMALSRDTVYRRLRSLGVHIRSHSNSMRGKAAPNRRGWYLSKGYKIVLLSLSDPFYCMADKRGYVREHRLVMARHLGRPLEALEEPHHDNENKLDNRIENLILETRASHSRRHMTKERA